MKTRDVIHGILVFLFFQALVGFSGFLLLITWADASSYGQRFWPRIAIGLCIFIGSSLGAAVSAAAFLWKTNDKEPS